MDERVKSEKEILLDKKIEEVRKRNEARLKKFQEAEEDRKRAEEAGCAVNMKKSSFIDDDHQKYHKGHHKAQNQKYENSKSKRYTSEVPEQSDVVYKSMDSADRILCEENNNISNNNNSNNSNSGQANHNNSRKERTLKSNIRAIYVPKHLQNRDSPENVKPPPPDPKNSFLADNYRTPTNTNQKNEENLEIQQQPKVEQLDTKTPTEASRGAPKYVAPLEFVYQGGDLRRQPATPLSAQTTFQGDARQRINQLKAMRNQEGQGTPTSNLPGVGERPATEPARLPPPPPHHHQQQHHHNKSHPHNFRHARRQLQQATNDGRPLNVDAAGKSQEKPIKSILKKPKVPVDDFDVSQPIMAVITTPGEEEEEVEQEGGGIEAQGYSRKKEEAICDWLKNSEFNNDEGGDDDEWEDVDDEEEEEEEEYSAADGQLEFAPTPVVEKANNDDLEGDEKLEAFEEDNAAFQEFIKQHTLTLNEEGGMDWATEMERLSLENKRKIDPEVLERAAAKD